MNEHELRRFADATRKGSVRHLLLSTLIFALVLAFEIAMHASGAVLAAVGAMYLFLVGYNVARIRSAAAARDSVVAARAFAEAQLASHRRRRAIYLVSAPTVLAATWLAVLLDGRAMPQLAWLTLAAATAFLVWGWFVWLRALRPRAQRA